jgi:drug/metabolite transporter (DMT)-like permease
VQKIIIAIYVLTTSLGLIVLKLGAKAGPPVEYLSKRVHFNINYYTVSGIILYALSFLFYIYLISKYDLGYIIPLAAAFVYILIFIASAIIFNEVFTVFKIAGITLIIGGLILLNLSK